MLSEYRKLKPWLTHTVTRNWGMDGGLITQPLVSTPVYTVLVQQFSSDKEINEQMRDIDIQGPLLV